MNTKRVSVTRTLLLSNTWSFLDISDSNDVTLYVGNESVDAYQNSAWKEFLDLNIIGTDFTAIGKVEAETETLSAGIFTMGGARVSDIAKPGLYIKNGKKVLVK